MSLVVKNLPESIPRQVDKKSGVPEDEEKGAWGSQGGLYKVSVLKEEERINIFFPLHSLVLIT